MRTKDMVRKVQALWCRYSRWMTGAVMVPPIVVLTAFFAIYTTVGTGYELGEIVHENAQYPYFISSAVKNMPDDWNRKTWDDYENGLISAYERDVRLGKSEKLRATTDELSERIWESGKERFWTEMKPFVWKETFQWLTGKATGRLFSSMHDVLTPEVAAKLPVEFAEKMGEEFVESVRLNDIGEALGEATYAVGLSKMDELAPEKKKEEVSELAKQLVELAKGMSQAIHAEPEQALVARFHHIIHNCKNDSRRLTEEQMMAEIKEEIKLRKLGELTQEGNDEGSSPGSIWKDEDEMARWLILQVEKIEPVKEGEPEKTPEEELEEEPTKEPEATPTEVEPEPEDIPLPMPFFVKSDAEKLAPSFVPTTYSAGKRLGLPKVDPSIEWWYGDGIQDTIMYIGRWGTRNDTVSVGVWCFEDAEKAQKLFRDELRPEAKTDAAIKDNERSKYGCPVIPDSFQESSDRITYQVPYCRQRDPEFFYEDEGEIIIYQIYRNTIIVIDGLFFDPDYEAQVRQIITDMEKNAMLVVDTAIERAKSQGWRE